MQFIRILALFIVSIASAQAGTTFVRLTSADGVKPQFINVLSELNARTRRSMTIKDFILQDERDLAFGHYQLYQQVAGGYLVEGKSIRIWTDQSRKKLIQAEAYIDLALIKTGREASFQFQVPVMNTQETMNLVRDSLNQSGEDTSIRGIDQRDRLVDGQVVRLITIRGKRGIHRITISLQGKKVIGRTYESFPQADTVSKSNTPEALVYPIYEEVEGEPGKLLSRQRVKLTNLNDRVEVVNQDPYVLLKQRHYYDFEYNPVLGSTPEGQAQGYWSMEYVQDWAAETRAALSKEKNSFQRGLLLHGKYVTINLHPDAFSTFKGINFPKKASAPLFVNWVVSREREAYEMIPSNGFYGKPLFSQEETLGRPARRLNDHDPLSYINDGFDEIQVYYAVNTFMEELIARGFVDPELSTRPFHAFLFNPDVEYRDNAFYNDDTINFTTYSSKQQNMARDNSTIWHELGHGIMDRLMGSQVRLADTGGLSEGMADFLAQIIVQAVTNNQPFPGSEKFRIINKTGFFLTNEVHDDGEAYGGAMNDFMMASIQREGRLGLQKVTDVILEAMRLCRDHPALTAKDWFDHILFADQLGRKGLRRPGELSQDLLTALNGRNFHLDGSSTASFKLLNLQTDREIVAGSEGARDHAIRVLLSKTGQEQFNLGVQLKGTADYSFRYPVTVKVEFEKGPLQGAVHWIGEEKGPKVFTIRSESEMLRLFLAVSGTCDEINRQDGSCMDYAYVQVFGAGDQAPRAKKRFYVNVKNP